MSSVQDDIRAFYKGKRVLLTGNTGFKGTWLNLLLNEYGAEVAGYSLPVSEGSFFDRVKPDTAMQTEADISDYSIVRKTVDEFEPEVIIHLASHSSLRGSMEIPEFILRTNMCGVLNVLESARNCESVKSIVIVTSDKCYSIRDNADLYSEEALLGAEDPYGTSKVCQELLTRCYEKTFFDNTGIASARASNCLGPGDDNETRLIPYLLNTFAEGRIPEIRHPESIRSWQYVLDVVDGYLLLAMRIYEDSGLSGAYNFGPEADGFVTVGEMTGRLAEEFGLASGYKKDITNSDHIKGETAVLKLDSTRAEQALSWRRRTSFSEAAGLTARFAIRTMLNREKESEVARQYIKDYCTCTKTE